MRNGAEACTNKTHDRVDKIDSEVWEEVSELLKDPERLRASVERRLEERRAARRGDPGRELKH